MGGDPFSDFHRGGGSQFNFGGGNRGGGGSQFGGFPGGFSSQFKQGGQGQSQQRRSKK